MGNSQVGIVSEEEYESLRVIGSRVARQNEAVLKSIQSLLDTGNATHESLQALIPVLQSIAEMKHEINVPIPTVTVEAAKVMMPDMPAPTVHVMESEEKPLKVDLTLTRKPDGTVTIKGTIG